MCRKGRSILGHAFANMLDPTLIIKTAGLLGIFLVVFAESGLLIGFFLPGDTLLFAAGIFALEGYFSLPLLIIIVALGSILGDNTGYWIGKRMGRKLFERENSTFFNKKGLERAENFYKKRGPITIIAARFVPIMRTFAPIVAGVAGMDYKKFFFYNVSGGILWAIVVPLLGYYLGGMIPNPDRFLLPTALLIIGFSFLPFFVKLAHYLISKRK